jgi:hypothetical protein
MSNWLANLKPGDEVVLAAGNYNDRVATVERLTETCIVLDSGEIFSRVIPDRPADCSFYGVSLRQATEERVRSIQRRQLIHVIAYAKSEQFDTLSNEELEAFVRTMKST